MQHIRYILINTVSHALTGFVIIIKALDKIQHNGTALIGTLLLCIGIFILIAGVFHSKIEHYIKNVKSYIYILEALVMSTIAVFYLLDDKKFLPYVCFLASMGFAIAFIYSLKTKSKSRDKK